MTDRREYWRGVEDERAAWKNIVDREHLICGQACPCGPNGELLACAYPPNPPGQPMHEHSWATLPTFATPARFLDLDAPETRRAIAEGVRGVSRAHDWDAAEAAFLAVLKGASGRAD